MSSLRRLSQAIVFAVGAFMAAGPALAQQHAAIDTARIEQITGLKGTFSTQEDVFKVCISVAWGTPRSSLKG